jgi:biopolymer transport protein ExbD
MARKKKSMPGINSSSTADIAFMLLIFFLTTTSMDTDKGLARRLPPPPDPNMQQDNIIVKERNILQVRINKDNQLMVGSDYMEVAQLRAKAKEFIANPNDDANLPEKHVKDIPLLGGACMVTEKHVISVTNDVGTSYQVYIDVQNELVAAYNELRNEMALARFGKEYLNCSEDEQKAIRDFYPQKISEAEPKKYGGK